MDEQHIHPKLSAAFDDVRRGARELKIEGLSLSRCNAERITDFLKGADFKTLTALCFQSCALPDNDDDGALDLLRECLKEITFLRAFRIGRTPLGNEHRATRMLSVLHTKTCLTELQLCQGVIRVAAGGRSVAIILQRNPTLRVLNLSGNRLNPEAIAELQPWLKQNPHLQELVLSQCNINDERFQMIAESLDNINLKVLRLSMNSISSNGIFALAMLLRRTRLEALHIDSNYSLFRQADGQASLITDALSCNKYLRVLNLSLCDMSQAFCAMMFKALENNKTLECLSVSLARDPSGAACRQLVKSVKTYKVLKELDLFFADFSSLQVELVASLEQNTSLEKLRNVLGFDAQTKSKVNNILERNRCWNLALSALPPNPSAITRPSLWPCALARVGDHKSGATGVFEICREHLPTWVGNKKPASRKRKHPPL